MTSPTDKLIEAAKAVTVWMNKDHADHAEMVEAEYHSALDQEQQPSGSRVSQRLIAELDAALAAHSAQPTTRDRDVQELQDERLETAALRSQNAELVEALRDLWASVSGGAKSCGHNYTCVCVGDKTRALLARVESR